MNLFIFLLGLITMISPLNATIEQVNSFGLPPFEEVNHHASLYPIRTPTEEGNLKVSKLHTLHYATYGNPLGVPVILLHGGPGAGCSDSLTHFFDPEKWFVVMFDQRGAMQSTPFACMEENTPQNSVEDIETLRKHLGIDQWLIFGGSWGSTLAILYGEAYPEKCLGFILRGIFLGREQDYLHLFYGMGKVFPEAYAPFVNYIPEEERGDLLTAYYQRIMDPNPEIHLPAARVFTQYDMLCATHTPDPMAAKKVVNNDQAILSISRAFMYYSYHRFFLEENQILSNIDKISHLPAIIVHGRWDAICLPDMAYQLHKQWQNSVLWIPIYGGHSSVEAPIAASLKEAVKQFSLLLKN